MQRNFNLEYMAGSDAILDDMVAGKVHSMPVFAEKTIDFLQKVSKAVLHDKEAREYPDVMTLGFWCRAAHIREMMADYGSVSSQLGRGIVFHVAPSNVAVNFAYSLVVAILAGNASIVRLPSKEFPQVDIICRILKQVMAEAPEMAKYILLVKYGHEKEINDYFSSICQTRVIWGGDNTIAEIRKSALPPRSNEITFADRHSLAVIDADMYMQAEDKAEIAHKFYNDTYLTDQNACTSPRIVIWIGKKTDEAQEVFWQELHNYLDGVYDMQPVQAVDKLTALYRLAAGHPVKLIPAEDNLITRVQVSSITEDLMDYKMSSGFFMEYLAENIEEIRPLLDIRCQTVSYYGFEYEIFKNKIIAMQPAGVDRIVPMGQTMDFALKWDGYDLIYAMSRFIG